MAFAVLLMNLCVPLIDMYTQPPIFGMKNKDDDADGQAAQRCPALRTAVILLIFRRRLHQPAGGRLPVDPAGDRSRGRRRKAEADRRSAAA
jgi:hypothetical protein